MLSELAKHNPGSPVIIVNAGAISPLVALVMGGALEVKQAAASALYHLSYQSPPTQLAIATGLISVLGVASSEAQEQAAHQLLRLCDDDENREAIARAGAIDGLLLQVSVDCHPTHDLPPTSLPSH